MGAAGMEGDYWGDLIQIEDPAWYCFKEYDLGIHQWKLWQTSNLLFCGRVGRPLELSVSGFQGLKTIDVLHVISLSCNYCTTWCQSPHLLLGPKPYF